MTEATTSAGAVDSISTEDLVLLNRKQEEEDEITRLEAEVIKQETTINDEGNVETSKESSSIKKPYIDEPEIDFKCVCGMEERVHYYGKTPQFAWGISLLEESYVMRDPFQPPPYPRNKPKAENFIIIGAKCTECQRSVCRDAACSFYYTSTFCLDCAEKQYKNFPIEVQAKLKKQLQEA